MSVRTKTQEKGMLSGIILLDKRLVVNYCNIIRYVYVYDYTYVRSLGKSRQLSRNNGQDDPMVIFVPVNLKREVAANHHPTAVIGPFQLGEDVVLRCVSQAGVPTPNVTWWKGDELYDDSFRAKNNVVINDLVVRKLRRTHLDQELACRASNSPLSEHAEARVRLDMKCKRMRTFLLLFPCLWRWAK